MVLRRRRHKTKKSIHSLTHALAHTLEMDYPVFHELASFESFSTFSLFSMNTRALAESRHCFVNSSLFRRTKFAEAVVIIRPIEEGLLNIHHCVVPNV